MSEKRRMRLPEHKMRQKPKRAEKKESKLGQCAISVYREPSNGSIDHMISDFQEMLSHMSGRTRGFGMEKNPSLSQLQMREIDKNRKYLGHLVSQEVVDEIYAEVPSLRKTMKVKVSGIGVFGSETTPAKPIGIEFDDATKELIFEERLAIRGILESMGKKPLDINDNEIEPNWWWLESKEPHITIGRVDINTPQEKMERAMGALEEICPEEFILRNAVIFNPGNDRINHQDIKRTKARVTSPKK